MWKTCATKNRYRIQAHGACGGQTAT